MSEKKFDCWTCKWKAEIPGDCHIACKHPALQGTTDNPLAEVISMLGGRRFGNISIHPPELKIRGHPTGIKNGWFNYPFNFDPTWLENCEGYKSNQVESDEGYEEA